MLMMLSGAEERDNAIISSYLAKDTALSLEKICVNVRALSKLTNVSGFKVTRLYTYCFTNPLAFPIFKWLQESPVWNILPLALTLGRGVQGPLFFLM